ncbi:MAG: hypothetical protein KGJ86_00050 [Chloroflexota bacterium]|nr:hypothetical protein [Chloroflexota bacterium]
MSRVSRRRSFAVEPSPETKRKVERTERQRAFEELSLAEQKRRFLAAYEANHGLTKRSCQQLGLRHSRVMEWRDEDESFAAQMDELADEADEELRNHIWDRATGQGQFEGKPSDLLAIFEAKRRMPDYRDKVQGGVTVNYQDNRNQVVLTLDDLRQGLGYLEGQTLPALPVIQEGSEQ